VSFPAARLGKCLDDLRWTNNVFLILELFTSSMCAQAGLMPSFRNYGHHTPKGVPLSRDECPDPVGKFAKGPIDVISRQARAQLRAEKQ
jgi:hypothetical protein